MICACFCRYPLKASLCQRPLALTTSKGTPHSRYSKVDPIWIPCPGCFSSPFSSMILWILVRKMVLVIGRMLSLCLNAKRWFPSGRLLILIWFARAFCRSTTPFCLAQKIFSPRSLVAFVHGMKMIISSRLFLSFTPCCTFETLTWMLGLKPLYRPNILESPRLSPPQIFAFSPHQLHPHESAIFRLHSSIPPSPRITDDPRFHLDQPLYSSLISPQVQPHFHLSIFLSSLRLLCFSDEVPSFL